MENLSTTTAANRGSRINEKQHVDYTHGEVLDQFKNTMLDVGVQPPETIIGDGKLRRFNINGKPTGWYILHLDGRAAGSFGCWKLGIKQNWKISGYSKRFTDEERQAFAEQRRADEIQRQKEEAAKHNAAAQKARFIWSNAKSATEQDQHGYLINKHIKPHVARLYGDALVIPIYNENNQLVNLQFIGADGTKRFLTGGQKKGCFCWVGEYADKVLIAEGYATATSIHESTGRLVVIAFDAGNLEPVARIIRANYPKAEIVIMADNDLTGIGQAKAQAAALAVAGVSLVCPVAGMDYNDFLNAGVA
jgi:putative DNA primase/helicase